MSSPPLFSVIIPTFMRPQPLHACLESLACQNYPRDRYEVIVVDDGSPDTTEAATTPFQARMQLRLLRAPHGGPAAARNAGAREAAGDLLAFTDDDCVPSPGWLQALAHGMSIAPESLIGGRTLNALPDNAYSVASQLLIDYLYRYYGRRGRQGVFFTTNNMAVSSQAFRKLGGFDISFTSAAGEDRDFCDRWVANGGKTSHAPDAIVHHLHALTPHSFWRQHQRYGYAAYHFHRLKAIRDGKPMRLEPPSFYLGLVAYPFRQFSTMRSIFLSGLLFVSQFSNAVGYVQEAMRKGLRHGNRLQSDRHLSTSEPIAHERSAAKLHVLYLSVTPDILDDREHFRRIYLRGLGARVRRISYLVCAPPGTAATSQVLDPNVTLFPIISRNRWQFIRRALRTAVQLHTQQPFDLTVCMTPIAPAATAYLFRRRTGVPFIVHWSHDFLGGWGWRAESPAHLLYWPWLRWITKRADSIRAIARPLADSILQGGVSPDRIRLLPTLLYRDIFVPSSHEESQPSPFMGRPPGERQILFVGRLAKQKNLPMLIRSVAELRHRDAATHLWVVGSGELRESLRQLVSELRMDPAITFVGNVPLTRLQPYYAHCDVFVLPSNHEGLARVLAEASFCAAPIVCTEVGGVVDHVLNGRTALVVPPNDVTALTKAIARLIDDRPSAHRLGDAARALVEKQYPPIEEQYDRWVDYWSDVAHRAPRPASPP